MPSSVIDLLEVGDTGICEIQTMLFEDFTLTVMSTPLFKQHCQVFASLEEFYGKAPVDMHFRPAPGDLVAALSPTEGWQRGRILTVIDDSYHVSFFDIGLSQKLITKVQTLPQRFASIPELGARASVLEYFIDKGYVRSTFLKPSLSYKFRVTHHTRTSCTISFLDEIDKKPMCSLVLTHWAPKYEDRGLKCVKLTNNEHVDVLSYSSARTMYVRPIDEDNDKAWQSVIQDVGAHCLSVDPLDRMPDRGELVASRYSGDNNYYRALVLSSKDEQILVSYVDIGNVEYVTTDRLKPISDSLKLQPCSAVLVKLKNVIPKPLTRKAVVFLNGLVAKTGLLKVTFGTSYSKEGVELLMTNNKPVSEVINKCLEPNWKQAITEGRNPSDVVLMCKQIKDIPFPTDKLFQLTILFVEGHDIFYACPFDNDVSHYVLTRLSQDIAEYCTALTNVTCYKPRVGELCLGKYDNVWYRAICKDNVESVSALMLVDHGCLICIENTCIRKMCEDFLWFDGLAVLCSIDGLQTNKSDDVRARLKQLIIKHSHHMARLIRVENDIMHMIEMPDIMQTLCNEGLLHNTA